MPVTFWLWLVIADSLTLVVLAEVVVALGPTVESSASALLTALLWTSLWLGFHLASATTNPARTDAVRQLVFSLLLLDLRTPAPLPCKDILGSYTYVGAVSASLSISCTRRSLAVTL